MDPRKRLFAHADDPEPTLEATESATSLGSAAAEEHGAPCCQLDRFSHSFNSFKTAGDEIKAEDADAQSLKCDDCNRHFRDCMAL